MKVRKKPVTVDAVQWTGGKDDRDAADFLGADLLWIGHDETGSRLGIKTLEGQHIANAGDWLIRGVKGEHYACKPDVFELTYEPVDG